VLAVWWAHLFEVHESIRYSEYIVSFSVTLSKVRCGFGLFLGGHSRLEEVQSLTWFHLAQQKIF
jgi:hypothetical protein